MPQKDLTALAWHITKHYCPREMSQREESQMVTEVVNILSQVDWKFYNILKAEFACSPQDPSPPPHYCYAIAEAARPIRRLFGIEYTGEQGFLVNQSWELQIVSWF